jgi:hypothetical protein
MQSTNTVEPDQEDVIQDLKYWANKKAHFEKKHDNKAIKVCDLMLDKYLDTLLTYKNYDTPTKSNANVS